MCCVRAAASYVPHLPHILIASFPLVLDVISCCFTVTCLQACSLGVVGYAVQPRCVVGYTYRLGLCNCTLTMFARRQSCLTHFSEGILIIKRCLTVNDPAIQSQKFVLKLFIFNSPFYGVLFFLPSQPRATEKITL